MSSTDYIQSLVTQSNNSGVELLENGELTFASKYLQFSFEQAQMEYSQIKSQQMQHINNHQQQHQIGCTQEQLHEEQQGPSPEQSPNHHVKDIPSQLIYECLLGSETTNSANLGLLYTQPIRLFADNDNVPSQLKNFSDDRVENSKIRVCIVLFNLALSFHLQWLDMKTNISQQQPLQQRQRQIQQDYQTQMERQSCNLILKATSLYNISYRILGDTINDLYYNDNTIITRRNAILDILFMATLNNLSQSVVHLKDITSEIHLASRNMYQQLVLFGNTARLYYVDMMEASSMYHCIDYDISSWINEQIHLFMENASLSLEGYGSGDRHDTNVNNMSLNRLRVAPILTCTGKGAPAA